MKGEGFTGDDLTIRYNARAEKDQAVALSVAATDVAFYRCKFSEYKDTLFTYCGKQFYKNDQFHLWFRTYGVSRLFNSSEVV